MLASETPTTFRTHAPAAADSFASVLRAAIAASNLGLARIHDHLRRRGVSVSVATLSYWQSGRSVPGRRSTLAALAHLEDVLRVPPGTLTTWVPQASAMRNARSVGRAPLESILDPGLAVPTALRQLDERLRNQLSLLSEHVIVAVGADRAQRSAWVRRVVRAETDGVDRFLTISKVDDAASTHRVVALMHCTEGETHTSPASPYAAREVILDRVLSQGESIVVEYQHEYGPPYPADARHEVRRRMPIGELVLEIRFNREALPARCEAYERPLPVHRVLDAATRRGSGPAARTDRATRAIGSAMALAPDADGRVRMSRRALDPGSYGIRWAWT